MPSMQRFELSPNDTIKLLTREPLLIVRVSVLKLGLPNSMRTIRKKPYKYHTFALHIPLELDGDDLDFLKLDYLSWLRLLDEVLRIAPPYFTMGETLVEIFSHVHYHQMDTELQANDIFYMPILNLRFNLINIALHLLPS
jgi:hypothetical protein